MSTVVESSESSVAIESVVSQVVSEDTPPVALAERERNALIVKLDAEAEARANAIAAKVSSGYIGESERNLSCGDDVIDDLIATREGVFLLNGKDAEWTTDHTRKRMEYHRLKIRTMGLVSVKAKEVRVETWVSAALLRRALVPAIGRDAAYALTFFELRELSRSTRALSFDESSLAYGLNEGWVEVIAGFARHRLNGRPFSAEKFEEVIATRVASIAEMKREESLKKDPEALRKKEDGIRRRQQRAKMKRLNESFTESGISRIEEGNGEVTVSTLLTDVAAIAKHVGKTVDPLCFLRGGALKKRHLGAILQLIQDIPSRESQAEMFTYLRDKSAEALAAMESSADESDDAESATVPMVAAS